MRNRTMGVKRKQADALSEGLALGKFDRGDWPLSFVAPDRDSKAVQFVKANVLHRAGLSVGEDYGFADQLSLGLLECAEDRGRAGLRSWHG
jgi:hypothetical protein